MPFFFKEWHFFIDKIPTIEVFYLQKEDLSNFFYKWLRFFK